MGNIEKGKMIVIFSVYSQNENHNSSFLTFFQSFYSPMKPYFESSSESSEIATTLFNCGLNYQKFKPSDVITSSWYKELQLNVNLVIIVLKCWLL